MRVIHNIPALSAHRQLGLTNRALGKNLERLSSGLRINRASDDAAGLAIAQRIDTQVLGLEQGTRNLLDGISVVQTAEASMDEIHKMLQRMRVLAIESANGSESADQREMIQAEIDQLLESVNHQAEAAEFNSMKLLTGDFSAAEPVSYKASCFSTFEASSGSGKIDIYAKFSTAGYETYDAVTGKSTPVTPQGSVIINGAIFSISDYDSTREFMDAVNASEKAGVTITYDKDLDIFKIFSDRPGEALRLTQSATDMSKAFFNVANIETGTSAAPGPVAQAISRTEVADGEHYTVNKHIIDTSKAFSIAGFDNTVSGWVRINGVQFSLADYATVGHFMEAINTDSQAGVTISYDSFHDEFTIKSDVTGENLLLSAGGARTGEVDFLEAVKIDQNYYPSPSSNATARSVFEILPNGPNMDIFKEGAAAWNDWENGGNFKQTVTGTVTINDATFSVSAYNTVNDFMKAVNASDKAKATIFYDNLEDKFIIRSDVPDGVLYLAESKSTSGYGFLTTANITPGTYGRQTAPNENWRPEGLLFHVGANKDQVIVTHIATVSSAALGIDVLEKNGVTNAFAAESAIRLLGEAIDHVSRLRSDLGAVQNRMEHQLVYNEVAHEEQSSALSRIRDLDFSTETIDFVKNQILLSSSTAMLAQANTLPQNVLTLLA
ncbi:MAG: flagellin [bacterium]